MESVIEILPSPPAATYELSVSNSIHEQLYDHNGLPLVRGGNINRAYFFTCVVAQTNRAAVSEWWVVMRRHTFTSDDKEHITRTAVGLDVETGQQSDNTPEIFVDGDGRIMLRLSRLNELQKVVVTVTTHLDRVS